MIIYSISKRIKNLFKVIVRGRQPSENIYNIRDNKYLTDIPNKDGYYRFFYPDGSVRAECHYVHDKLEGISNFYYPTGKIKSKENYRNGSLSGLSHFFYETGRLRSAIYYKDGKIASRQDYNEKGRII